jgi:hypothetical protein
MFGLTPIVIFEMFKECRSAIESMAERQEENSLTIARQYHFTTNLQTQNVLEVLIPEDSYNIEEIIKLVENQQKRLTLAERWEERGFDGEVREWLFQNPRPLLYISGTPTKNGISFLSSFMVDLAGVLNLEADVGISYVFCDVDSDVFRLTPDFLIRQIIGQLLSSYPQITVDYVNELPLSRFRACGRSTASAFELLRIVLLKARAQLHWPTRGFFILIDRFDLVQDTKDCSVLEDFLPALQILANQFDDLDVVITSSIASRFLPMLEEDEFSLWSIATRPPGIVPFRQS